MFSSDPENQEDLLYSVDDVIVLEIEVKGSVEPFQVLLEPYALIIPGENYIGINVKKDFKVRPPPPHQKAKNLRDNLIWSIFSQMRL